MAIFFDLSYRLPSPFASIVFGKYHLTSQKTWGPGAYIPRDKRSMVKLEFFLTFEVAKSDFFDLSMENEFTKCSLFPERDVRSKKFLCFERICM